MAERAVWKFPLRWGEVFVDMPKYAQIVHVGMDPASDYPAIWAIVDPNAERETRNFSVVSTGQIMATDCIHVGSLIEDRGVWHIFEKTPSQVLAAMLGAFGG